MPSTIIMRPRRAVLLATSMLIAAGSQAAAQPVVSPQADPAQIEEIVVTAQRRAVNLLETPVAVSSFDGAKLETRQVRNLSDLTTLTPGVQFGTQFSNAKITIRGIGNQNASAGADPGVAFHLDGVYLGQTGLAGASFLDVERVEILRGPQGTIFGRNATGGAVNVISRKPTAELEAEIGAALGIDPFQYHLDGFVSGPVIANGNLRGRFSARRDYNRGYTRNLAQPGPDRLDDQDVSAVRGQLQFVPTDQFDAVLSIDYQKGDDNGPATFLLGTPTVSDPTAIAASLGGVAGDIATRTAQNNQGLGDQSFLGVRLNADWKIGSGTLKALAAYDRTRSITDQDGDGTSANFTSTEFRQRAHQFYGELVYASDTSGRFDYLIGANAFKETARQTILVPIAFLPVPVTIQSTLDTRSFALFGHGDFRLTDRAKLFGGLRYSWDEKEIDESNNFVGTLSQKADWNRLTYEVGASYDLSDTVHAYLKYSTGYKGGGFQAGNLAPPFAPETNNNIEAGLKGLYFNRRVEANIAVFHMNYDNLQVNQITGVTATVTNAAKATIDGVEAEIIARLTPALRAELTGSYLDATFDEFRTADSARPALGELDLAGNRLPSSPQFTYSAGLYYTLSVATAGSLTLGGRYYWRDKVYFSEFNIPVASETSAGRIDLSLNYESDDGRWQAGIYARNLTDEKVLTNVQVVSALLGSLALGHLDTGRNVGILLRRRF